MHGEEIEYIKQAYETNWMSTIGANIDEAELKDLLDYADYKEEVQ